jgi:hypothetical protein
MPAHEAIKYLLGAYSVFAVLMVTWGVIMARRMTRVRRELSRYRDDR